MDRFDEQVVSAEPQNTAVLLTELRAVFGRYLVLPKFAATAIALWVLHTWALEAAHFTPRLALTSPTKRCGKSTLLDLLFQVCRRALRTANATAAALFRSVDAYQPTLLIDEADSFLADKEEVRGIIDAGYERGGSVLRCVGDDHEPTPFDCFSPLAIAAIGSLPGTVADRSITIRMERKRRHAKVERRDRRAREQIDALKPRLARWAQDNVEMLKGAEPELPDQLNDRQRDICEPLLAIADLAEESWPKRARKAVVRLCLAAETDAADLAERALRDVWEQFDNALVEFKSLKDLVEAMLKNDSGGWDTADKGRPLTTGKLARLLLGFGLVSKQKRVPGGEHARGYERAQLLPVAKRYLRKARQPLGGKGATARQPTQPPVTPTTQRASVGEADPAVALSRHPPRKASTNGLAGVPSGTHAGAVNGAEVLWEEGVL